MRSRRIARCTAVLVVLGTGGARAQQAAADSGYARADTMIAMRDGTRLHTVILTPRDAGGPLPILMVWTPYGATDYASFLARGASGFGLGGYNFPRPRLP